MSDFKLDDSGDLDISSGGYEIVEDEDAVAQELKIRSKQVEGDWFLGLNEGIPLFSRVMINGPNLSDVYQIYGNEFLQADNVVRIQSLQLFESPDNALTIRSTVLSTFGAITIQEAI